MEGFFPIFLNRILYASFIVLLLFFWLCMFDGIRKEAENQSFWRFYGLKIGKSQRVVKVTKISAFGMFLDCRSCGVYLGTVMNKGGLV